MMKKPVFEGCCTALITPFTEDSIDEERLRSLLDFQAERGASAVVLAGTTGENATLREREYRRLLEAAADHVSGRLKLIAGVGGNNTETCAEKARFASKAGMDAVLMTPPYYNKTTQRGIIRHFSAVADTSEIPLILYNVPGRTAIGISQASYQTLSRNPNINGVKEASGDFSLLAFLASECGEELNLWCGNDDQLIPAMSLGAKGVISVVSNLLPEDVAAVCAACAKNDYPRARERFRRYADLCRQLFSETNPIPIKTAMRFCGMDSGKLRLPLVEMSPSNAEMLKASIKRLGLP